MSNRPLIGLKDILSVAEELGTCMPAFDVGGGNPDFVRAVLEVCREKDSAALFIGWVGSVKGFGFGAVAAQVRSLASEAGVPAALELDHAHKEEDILAAIEAGFTGVMFDGAEAPFEENVAQTRRIVEQGRKAGVAAEAALGHIAGEDSVVTDPAQAAEFVEATGIDVLTPAVGNKHGCRGFTVPLDWDVIGKLNGAVGVPMALHGGSGIALEDVRRAANFGFRKLNVATKLHVAYTEGVRSYVLANPEHGWFRWSSAGREALKAVVAEYIGALGLAGSAKALR